MISPTLTSQFPESETIKAIAELEGDRLDKCSESRIWYYVYCIAESLAINKAASNSLRISEETKQSLEQLNQNKNQSTLVGKISHILGLQRNLTLDDYYTISFIAKELSASFDTNDFVAASSQFWFDDLKVSLQTISENREKDLTSLMTLMTGFFF